MFDISIVTIVFIIIWILLYILVSKSNSVFASNLLNRLPSFLGSGLCISSFFFHPWIKINILSYFVNDMTLAEIITELGIPDVLNLITKSETFSNIILVLENFTEIKGPYILLLPGINSIFKIIVIVSVINAFFIFIWTFIGSLIQNKSVEKFTKYVSLIISSLSLLCIVYYLPILDSLGMKFLYSFIPLLLGTTLGNGIWFFICGIILILIGKLIETQSSMQEKDPIYEDIWEY